MKGLLKDSHMSKVSFIDWYIRYLFEKRYGIVTKLFLTRLITHSRNVTLSSDEDRDFDANIADGDYEPGVVEVYIFLCFKLAM